VYRRLSGPGNFSVDTVRIRAERKHLEIIMSADIWRAMGEPKRIGVFIGAGADIGKLALEPDNDDGYVCDKPHARASSRRVHVSRSKLGITSFKPCVAEHTMTGTRLIIKLPRGVLLTGSTEESA
jgi:hypothetical protein